MKISIAMATCEGARFLDEQLRSFVEQSRRPDELVVADDVSTDETGERLRAFHATAPFSVHLEFNARRLGVLANFDRALGMTHGDLVLLSDQDDVWLPNKIEILERRVHENPQVGCFVHDAWLADAELEPIGTTKMSQIRASGLPATAMVQGCCAAFRRPLLNLLLPIPPDQPAHDNWLVQMADLLGQTLRLEEPLQYYRRHGRNVSNNVANRIDSPDLGRRGREWASNLLRRSSSVEGLDIELRFYLAGVKRLEERRASFVDVVGLRAVDGALRQAESMAALLARRKAIHGMPRWRRLPHVLRLWQEDGYRRTGRLAGAAKDLFLAHRDRAS